MRQKLLDLTSTISISSTNFDNVTEYFLTVKSAITTRVNVDLTASVSKGGRPTKRVYNKQPRPQTSASSP